MSILRLMIAALGTISIGVSSALAADPQVIDLWPAEPPGPASKPNGPERDITKDEDRLIAGRRIIKLANVSKPQMHVFLPAIGKANGGAVVVCPGGGFSILAWDLEGTEVADWLNSLGYAAIVLKYRVPTREHGESLNDGGTAPLNALGPMMDVQRAVSLTRASAADWKIDPAKIGILGFSAGGKTAALAALQGDKRAYEKTDTADEQSCASNFALLIYPYGLSEKDGALKEHLKVEKDAPPTFFAHAADDPVSYESSVALFTALKRAGVKGELHVYPTGGHGYGLRPTEEPVTHWTELAEKWLARTVASDKAGK